MADLNDMNSTVEMIRRGLGSLPGNPAQGHMSPIPRRGEVDGGFPSQARPGATILLIFPEAGIPHIVLTKRSQEVEHHKGQISFPGGLVEPGESLEEAALREAQEEIGVEPESVTLIGPLSPLYIPVSGFVMHPFIGTIPNRISWQPARQEVDSVLTPSLLDLADPINHRTEERNILGQTRKVPYFSVDQEKVWGATAMVLSEFMVLLGVSPRPDKLS